MDDLTKIILTWLFTVIGAVIIFLSTKIIEKFYIEPYYKFKSELTKTKIKLYFYNNLFTNHFEVDETNKEFIKKILSAQEEIRLQWSKLQILYTIVVNKKILMIFCNKKIPNTKEMNQILVSLIRIYNSNLFHYNNIPAENDSPERNDELIRLLDILLKYT